MGIAALPAAAALPAFEGLGMLGAATAAPAAAGALGAGAGGAGLLGGSMAGVPLGSSLPGMAWPQAMAALGAPTPEKFLAPTMMGQIGQVLEPMRNASRGMNLMNQLTAQQPQQMQAPQQNAQVPRPMAASGPMERVPSPIEIAAYKRQMRRMGRA